MKKFAHGIRRFFLQVSTARANTIHQQQDQQQQQQQQHKGRTSFQTTQVSADTRDKVTTPHISTPTPTPTTTTTTTTTNEKNEEAIHLLPAPAVPPTETEKPLVEHKKASSNTFHNNSSSNSSYRSRRHCSVDHRIRFNKEVLSALCSRLGLPQQQQQQPQQQQDGELFTLSNVWLTNFTCLRVFGFSFSQSSTRSSTKMTRQQNNEEAEKNKNNNNNGNDNRLLVYGWRNAAELDTSFQQSQVENFSSRRQFYYDCVGNLFDVEAHATIDRALLFFLSSSPSSHTTTFPEITAACDRNSSSNAPFASPLSLNGRRRYFVDAEFLRIAERILREEEEKEGGRVVQLNNRRRSRYFGPPITIQRGAKTAVRIHEVCLSRGALVRYFQNVPGAWRTPRTIPIRLRGHHTDKAAHIILNTPTPYFLHRVWDSEGGLGVCGYDVVEGHHPAAASTTSSSSSSGCGGISVLGEVLFNLEQTAQQQQQQAQDEVRTMTITPPERGNGNLGYDESNRSIKVPPTHFEYRSGNSFTADANAKLEAIVKAKDYSSREWVHIRTLRDNGLENVLESYLGMLESTNMSKQLCLPRRHTTTKTGGARANTDTDVSVVAPDSSSVLWQNPLWQDMLASCFSSQIELVEVTNRKGRMSLFCNLDEVPDGVRSSMDRVGENDDENRQYQRDKEEEGKAASAAEEVTVGVPKQQHHKQPPSVESEVSSTEFASFPALNSTRGARLQSGLCRLSTHLDVPNIWLHPHHAFQLLSLDVATTPLHDVLTPEAIVLCYYHATNSLPLYNVLAFHRAEELLEYFFFCPIGASSPQGREGGRSFLRYVPRDEADGFFPIRLKDEFLRRVALLRSRSVGVASPSEMWYSRTHMTEHRIEVAAHFQQQQRITSSKTAASVSSSQGQRGGEKEEHQERHHSDPWSITINGETYTNASVTTAPHSTITALNTVPTVAAMMHSYAQQHYFAPRQYAPCLSSANLLSLSSSSSSGSRDGVSCLSLREQYRPISHTGNFHNQEVAEMIRSRVFPSASPPTIPSNNSNDNKQRQHLVWQISNRKLCQTNPIWVSPFALRWLRFSIPPPQPYNIFLLPRQGVAAAAVSDREADGKTTPTPPISLQATQGDNVLILTFFHVSQLECPLAMTIIVALCARMKSVHKKLTSSVVWE